MSRARSAAALLRMSRVLVRLGLRRHATYRGATLAGVFTNTVWGFMLAFVQLALFHARPHIAGYDAADAITYVWLTQGMLMTVHVWNWTDIAERVRTGDIATDLHRPADFQGYWLAQDLGRAGYHALFRGIPPVLLASFVFRLRFPAHPLTWVWFALSLGLAVCVSFSLRFALSLGLAVCVSFSLRFLVNLSAFWIHDHRGGRIYREGIDAADAPGLVPAGSPGR